MTTSFEPHVESSAQITAHAMGTAFVATGASQTRAKRIGDREKTAARLLRSAVERSYDAEVDIDWDEPWVGGKHFAPEHRLSLYGTRIWDKLSHEQRIELSRQEMASIFSFGIFAEASLSSILFRCVATGALTDDATRYMLTEIGDETRHSTMFSRAINKLGVKPLLLPRWVTQLFIALVNVVPTGAAIYGWTLLIEEILDRLQREATLNDSMQPHLRQLFKIHVLEEARHITFAREELVRSYQASGRSMRALHRMLIALVGVIVLPLLFHPVAYRRALGMSPLRGLLVAQLNPNYRANVQFACEPMIRYFHEAGLITGKLTLRLWKLTRALPDDIHAEAFGAPRKQRTPSLVGRGFRKLIGV
ncbi:hypothetical protein HMPREF9336_01860 [Segniliparus rugosus ATCC BAA-974]|uniref:p-aminobenzoate N-oxygenase AurF n=2 Tax=Segniliparus rugosus TaxID=286804 RepID=E5XQT8_SEGRC|nr:hypothetical protein HMPREF9336_01860 [Segniliparus rugosus ATCC BAA-974]